MCVCHTSAQQVIPFREMDVFFWKMTFSCFCSSELISALQNMWFVRRHNMHNCKVSDLSRLAYKTSMWHITFCKEWTNSFRFQIPEWSNDFMLFVLLWLIIIVWLNDDFKLHSKRTFTSISSASPVSFFVGSRRGVALVDFLRILPLRMLASKACRPTWGHKTWNPKEEWEPAKKTCMF